MSSEYKPRAVSFSAGGVRIIGHMGCLAGLLESDVLSEVREWYGCSGGAACALFGALGVTAAWIRDAAAHFDTRAIPDIREELVSDFLIHWGVDSGEGFMNYLGRFMDTWEPGSSAWTFADLARERPDVILSFNVVNVTRCRLEQFGTRTTPDMRILEAVRASGAIPGFFTPWIAPSGDLYADGAILEYYPWRLVADRERTLVIVGDDAEIDGRGQPASTDTLGGYVSNLLRMAMVWRPMVGPGPRNWIAVNNRHIGPLDFHIERDTRIQLFEDGLRAARGWMAFRAMQMTGSAPGKHGNRRPYVDPCISASGCPAPDRTLDNPQSQNQRRLPSAVRDSRTGMTRVVRRWSL